MNKLLPVALLVAAAALPLWAQDNPMASKSIFSRDRRPRPTWSPSTQEATSRPAPPPRLPVLIGIAREPDHILAVFENPSTGQITKARLGEQLPGEAGRIESMTLDYIETRSAPDAAPIRIAIGQDIKGSAIQMPAPATNPTTDSASAPAGAGGEDLISRLRRRRQQEMGR